MLKNEEGNIEALTEDILAVYVDRKIDGEVLLIDDGSTDSSGEICDRLTKVHPNVRVVHHEKNLGRSYAIRTGFQQALGDVVIIMDADRQYEPKQIPLFLAKMDEGFDVVTGWRRERTDTFIRRFISRTYNRFIIRRKFKLQIKDQNSGFKAFRREKAVAMGFDPEGYQGLHRFILPLAALKGLKIAEVPIVHYDRPSGKSYIKFYTVPFITLRDFSKFKKDHKEEIVALRQKG
ncbi:MAG TPA: glycosyltransferase family 2 protein [Methanomassiliicoccales archaeon]|nr:glycosyltransferase family 2 protein [Methanomassiliicoccales archaeon]HNX47915.1 glycosyltransferase family 2 protein [Methanomassiliicoccales archaeon]HPR97695.1 glycosyltransferase family 2 protein [Methanomassiliicoccales archaeon]